ncbi:hypothetical protein ATY37_14105 [Vibrio cidicii]|uniref:GmrSD restriction endonucleases N-terminal domain-containing protein n=1 Tax=Vibrio cidicii TaxID=1763883 RepID=A0A151KZ26_9VIBR|nr:MULTISPECIES: DUF262 domain-containing protein [Vibrio]EIZ1353988.1 DUF262 domain-containing protein [Vibrio vulnificus]EGQ8946787.1 DUF262 domain-containing protein [Vibrio parahaemolyticus]EGR3006964.1 DUF262 domain-containing protein [Vibrio parahaemolyticus]EGR3144880.1 DUF262 domain-containing protein [Vibrio parahaemolyticus]EGR3183528.1 DUF262 domain-containing protein [Vibrio parahaemolyticus]
MASVEQLQNAELQLQEFSKKIDFYTSEYTVEILAQKVANKEFGVPDYQREFTWEPERRCRFIESLLMGLPIPFVFLWMNDQTGQLEIVDGSQRLRTIEEYINNRLQLEGLERLNLLNGTKFEELTIPRQRKIKNQSIRAIVLSDKTDLESRVDLFERINTGSKVANPAEVRRGALRGPFMEFIINIANNEQFTRLATVTKSQKSTREREELALRFFAYTDGLDAYKDKVKEFLFNYTRTMNTKFEEQPELAITYQERLTSVLNFVEKSFELGFRKTAGAKTTPRSRFEAIAIGSYKALTEKPDLAVTQAQTEAIVNSAEFKKKVTSDGANVKSKLEGRIDVVKKALLEEE